MALQAPADGKINRQTMVPFHLKLFYRTGHHHNSDEFPTSPHHSLPQHLQIYTWPSCTLRELSHLLTTALPSLLPDPMVGTRLSYRLIFPFTRETRNNVPPQYATRDIGTVIIAPENGNGELPGEESASIVGTGPMSGRLEGDPERTLQDARFVIGDYISCAILPPGPNGEAPFPADRGRENGFPIRRGRGGFGRGSSYGRLNDGGVPTGEWRRGERIPEGPRGRGFGRPRDRGW